MYDLLYMQMLQLFNGLLELVAWLGPEGTFVLVVGAWLARDIILRFLQLAES